MTVMVNQSFVMPETKFGQAVSVEFDRLYDVFYNPSAEYTIVTFIPRNLFEQFRR